MIYFKLTYIQRHSKEDSEMSTWLATLDVASLAISRVASQDSYIKGSVIKFDDTTLVCWIKHALICSLGIFYVNCLRQDEW